MTPERTAAPEFRLLDFSVRAGDQSPDELEMDAALLDASGDCDPLTMGTLMPTGKGRPKKAGNEWEAKRMGKAERLAIAAAKAFTAALAKADKLRQRAWKEEDRRRTLAERRESDRAKMQAKYGTDTFDRKEYMKEYYRTHTDKFSAQRAEWRAKGREKVKCPDGVVRTRDSWNCYMRRHPEWKGHKAGELEAVG